MPNETVWKHLSGHENHFLPGAVAFSGQGWGSSSSESSSFMRERGHSPRGMAFALQS